MRVVAEGVSVQARDLHAPVLPQLSRVQPAQRRHHGCLREGARDVGARAHLQAAQDVPLHRLYELRLRVRPHAAGRARLSRSAAARAQDAREQNCQAKIGHILQKVRREIEWTRTRTAVLLSSARAVRTVARAAEPRCCARASLNQTEPRAAQLLYGGNHVGSRIMARASFEPTARKTHFQHSHARHARAGNDS